MKQENKLEISNSDYDKLILDSFKNSNIKEKSITIGKIVSIENDIVTTTTKYLIKNISKFGYEHQEKERWK